MYHSYNFSPFYDIIFLRKEVLIMDNFQIAHDLAVAKAVKEGSGSKEILDLYHTYNDEFLTLLSKEPVKVGKATATEYPSAK
jgi:hypothetical protein